MSCTWATAAWQRLNGTALEPLTTDHRVTLSPTESYLSRALGAEPRVEVDYRKVPLAVGDVFLLTTDGVHDHIDGRAVRAALDAPSLDDAAQAIARAALDRGSADNLTVQILRIEALPDDAVLTPEIRLPVPALPGAGDVIDGFRIVRPVHASPRSHVFLAVAPSAGAWR